MERKKKKEGCAPVREWKASATLKDDRNAIQENFSIVRLPEKGKRKKKGTEDWCIAFQGQFHKSQKEKGGIA